MTASPARRPGTNDFVIKIATVNGTGSASANSLIMKAIFRMGVPVVGKNFFPSNIQGLPTWYEIRVTGDGHRGRSGFVDVMVAMNAETYLKDLAEVSPGGLFIYDSTWPRNRLLVRDDITILGIPLAAMCNENFSPARVRILMKNIAYAGALAALLKIDLEVIEELLKQTFKTKPKLVGSNMEAVRLGYDFATTHWPCPVDWHLEPMDKTSGHVMIDGNTAAGLGCVYAGATVGAWYPITPSTSLMDAFAMFAERLRKTDAGDRKAIVIQAEDELSAIGMVVGAAWNGARAFTPTSGPGVSLMSEFIGFAYFTEIPVVLWNIQRVGPSTGMPTRTQQGDILTCAYASHGDTKHICLYPADPAECFEMAHTAFDLAERFQTPVFVVSDLDIGMNDWMVPDLEYKQGYQPDRGKVLHSDDLDRVESFYRYMDVDGDGIPYRTIPGEDPRGAFFTRGSGHSSTGKYTEDADEYREVLDRLSDKFDTARRIVPAAIVESVRSPDLGIIYCGSSTGAVDEAVIALKARGFSVGKLRIRAFPFGEEVEEFIAKHPRVMVMDQNRDGQLRTLLVNETSAPKAKLESIRHYDGMPLTSSMVIAAIDAQIARSLDGQESAA